MVDETTQPTPAKKTKPLGRTQKLVIAFVAVPFFSSLALMWKAAGAPAASDTYELWKWLIGTGITALTVGAAYLKGKRAQNGG